MDNDSFQFFFSLSLKSTKSTLKSWNTSKFRFVHNSIKSMKSKVEVLQSLPWSSFILEKDKNLQDNSDELLKREQLLWWESIRKLR